MKKWMVVSIVIGLVLAMSACGGSQNSSTAATASTALSQEGKLLVGTLKLESTSLAVSSTQAEQLLPLWETMQSLASSGTAASQEVDAVVSQIESTMSAEQISSITSMNLTQQDLAAVVVDTGASSTISGTASTTNASSIRLQAGAGETVGGIPPTDVGGMPVSSGGPSTDQIQNGSTQAVNSQTTGTTSQVSPALINALVVLLQKKIV
jgi:hypothetical protein